MGLEQEKEQEQVLGLEQGQEQELGLEQEQSDTYLSGVKDALQGLDIVDGDMENIDLPELLALAVTGAGVRDLLAKLGGGRGGYEQRLTVLWWKCQGL